MNKEYEKVAEKPDGFPKESRFLFNQEDNDHIEQTTSIKANHPTTNYLPSSLLKDLNSSPSSSEEEEDEEQDVYNDEEFHLKSCNSFENKDNGRKLKAPSKKNKDKFYSLDDIQSFKLFQFQKMKQNQLMYQYQMQQQQQMLYANHHYPSFQPNNYLNPSQYYQQQSPQLSIQPQPFNGNYMMPPFIGMHQPHQMKGLKNIPDASIKGHKHQVGFDMKTLGSPKRMLSSPVGCFTSAKKKKEKKKSMGDNLQSLEELLKLTNGDLFSFITTQKGSREVQKLLYKITPSDLAALVTHLSDHMSDLMIDKYANYFCQKLIQNCLPELRIQILHNILDRFIEISCNSFGTHSLQTLIEIANMPSEHEVLCKCIETGIMTLALDSKGTHVLQKFLSCCNESQQGSIPLTLIENFNKLINDSHGVCVLIKLVQNNTDKTLKERLIALIAQNALEIIQNPFGNYVVQSLFKETDVASCKDILKVICDNFFSLSMQKFSSNVVENVLGLVDEDTLKHLCNEVIASGKLGSMVKNTYGNFVVEKLISLIDKDDKKLLYQELQFLGCKEKGLNSTLANMISQ